MAALSGRSLMVTIGGTEYNAQLFTASIDADDADDKDVTFAEAAAGGGRLYTLNLKLTQDMATGTLWTKIFDAAGTDVACVLKPYGKTTPSTSQPHFTFTATVKEPNGTFIGGDADASPTKRQTVEVEWPLGAKPVRVTA
jgi:hypothetical protein